MVRVRATEKLRRTLRDKPKQDFETTEANARAWALLGLVEIIGPTSGVAAAPTRSRYKTRDMQAAAK